MAIDTINEKFALISLLKPWEVPLPISTDALGQDDKQHLLWNYPGILWEEPVIIILPGVGIFDSDFISKTPRLSVISI